MYDLKNEFSFKLSPYSQYFPEPRKVLLVDDDPFFHKAFTKLFAKNLPPEIILRGVKTLSEVKKIISQENFHLAICDFHLPDAETGEAILFLRKNNIPTIALTGSYEPQTREFCINAGVADVLLKNLPNLSELIITSVIRILKNLTIKVLIVDDSPTFLKFTSKILQNIGLNVLEADSASKAREIFNKYKEEIRCILLDYYLETEAMELLLEIRKKFPKNKLGIIIISAYVNNIFVPQLLKAGANDFLRKPFLEEELKVRINNLLDFLDSFKELSFLAYHDPLTGLLNRRAFFAYAWQLFSMAKRNKLKVAVVLFDLDYFKKLNDTFGHQAGDAVLQNFAQALKNYFRRNTDLLCRFGGEEFCLFCCYENPEQFLKHLENFREKIAQSKIKWGKNYISYTFSAGVELTLKENFETMIKSADNCLYLAKEQGRNRIVYNYPITSG